MSATGGKTQREVDVLRVVREEDWEKKKQKTFAAEVAMLL